MNMWTAIVIIVLVGVGLEAFRTWVNAKEKEQKAGAPQLNERLDALEKRLSNLETILIRQQNEEKWESLKD